MLVFLLTGLLLDGALAAGHRQAPTKEDVGAFTLALGEFFGFPKIHERFEVRFMQDIWLNRTEVKMCHFKPILDFLMTLDYDAVPEIFECYKKLKGVEIKCDTFCKAANKMDKECKPKFNPEYNGIAAAIKTLSEPGYYLERQKCTLDSLKEVGTSTEKVAHIEEFVPCLEKALEKFFTPIKTCSDPPATKAA